MSADREQLARIGELAIAEHAQWIARNEAKAALKKALRGADMGRHELSPEDWEPDEWAEWQALVSAEQKAQVRLGTRRAATRRAITRAAAALGKGMP